MIVSSAPAISLLNLTVCVENKMILENISFEVKEGECISIIGQNGAGKTSILKAILGLLPIKQGIICIFGEKRMNSHHNRLIGYVPQLLTIDEYLPITSFDVMQMGCTARKGILSRRTNPDKMLILDVAQKLGIADLLHKKFSVLSGGERQKVLIGRALCQKPKILLLDEFYSHLSTEAIDQSLKLIMAEKEEKHFTLVMVTHKPEIAKNYSTRIIKLSCGRKVYDINSNEFICTGANTN